MKDLLITIVYQHWRVVNFGEHLCAPYANGILFKKEFQDPTGVPNTSIMKRALQVHPPSCLVVTTSDCRTSPQKKCLIDVSLPTFPSKNVNPHKKQKLQQICFECNKKPTPKMCTHITMDFPKCVHLSKLLQQPNYPARGLRHLSTHALSSKGTSTVGKSNHPTRTASHANGTNKPAKRVASAGS